jgi:deoxyadenosine/deoxycytidine kinase
VVAVGQSTAIFNPPNSPIALADNGRGDWPAAHLSDLSAEELQYHEQITDIQGRGYGLNNDFLIRRFEQLKALDVRPASQNVIIADYIFEKDKLFACLNLTDPELEIYNRYYNLFRDQLPTPDLVIYLQATPEVLKKRLKKKGSATEAAISDDYLEEVVHAYEHFFFHYTASDLLIVDTSQIDFVEQNEDLQQLLRKVSEPVRGTQYFLPLSGGQAASA